MTPFTTAQAMLARRQVRVAAVAALQRIAGLTVQSPGDWNTPPSKLPAALVRTPSERKDGAAKSQPNFTTTVTLEIDLRVQGSTAEAAQDALEALGYTVEETLLRDYSLNAMIQQFSGVDVDAEITAEGGVHFGGARMRIACETLETFGVGDPVADGTVTPGPWPVSPPATVDLTSVGVHLDMLDPFDPTGTYTPSPDAPAYTPTPAPRTVGPDGRDEAALDINLPQ
jgi:hypothetical protein